MVENISNIVDKLRSGEVVRCLKCNEGKYITNPKYLKQVIVIGVINVMIQYILHQQM